MKGKEREQSMGKKEQKAFKLPHQLVILFAIAALATLATYIEIGRAHV